MSTGPGVCRPNCDRAGLRGQVRAWLAGNGYASAANFKALDHLMLLVAVRGEASQTGRGDAGGTALPEGWQHMAARLASPSSWTTGAAPPPPPPDPRQTSQPAGRPASRPGTRDGT